MKHFRTAATVLFAVSLAPGSVGQPRVSGVGCRVSEERTERAARTSALAGPTPDTRHPTPDSGIAWAGPAETKLPPPVTQPASADNAYLPTADEIKLGREGAAEAEKQYKIIKDGEQVRRIQTIGDEIVGVANSPEVIRAYMA